VVAERAGFSIPPDKSFLIVEETQIGREHLFSSEKLGTVLAIFGDGGPDKGGAGRIPDYGAENRRAYGRGGIRHAARGVRGYAAQEENEW
jgi:hypothetical protein